MNRQIINWAFNIGVILLLAACLWIPDPAKALARAYLWDALNHWDANIMMPGWAYLHQEGLDTSIFSPWAIGAVAFMSRCSQMLGSFSYDHLLTVMMVMVILYYAALYSFFRRWLHSAFLAAALLAITVKLQMFHSGISPLIWAYPQDTPVRHWLDLPVLGCFLYHARSLERKYLTFAAIGIGVSLVWSLSVGLCLLMAFWGYMVYLSVNEPYRASMSGGFKEVRRTLLEGILPLAVMGLVLFLVQGESVFHSEFWVNLVEPLRLFVQGVGTLPFYACLYDRHFFAFITGFILPVIYAWTLIAVIGFPSKSRGEGLFLIPLCIYGLAMYMHYLAHASTSHYYAVGIPAVMVLGWWISQALTWLSQAEKLRVLVLLTAGAWFSLFTNIYFVYYPNIFDISHNQWKAETDPYQSSFNLSKDAAMIARLTPQDKGAALISSFEAGLLMEAGRKPFFYYAPLVISERLDKNGLQGTCLITRQRLEKTLRQISAEAPPYIFVDKRLLLQWPQIYVRLYPELAFLLQYVVEHYQPEEQGQLIIAMRRKIS